MSMEHQNGEVPPMHTRRPEWLQIMIARQHAAIALGVPRTWGQHGTKGYYEFCGVSTDQLVAELEAQAEGPQPILDIGTGAGAIIARYKQIKQLDKDIEALKH